MDWKLCKDGRTDINDVDIEECLYIASNRFVIEHFKFDQWNTNKRMVVTTTQQTINYRSTYRHRHIKVKPVQNELSHTKSRTSGCLLKSMTLRSKQKCPRQHGNLSSRDMKSKKLLKMINSKVKMTRP